MSLAARKSLLEKQQDELNEAIASHHKRLSRMVKRHQLELAEVMLAELPEDKLGDIAAMIKVPLQWIVENEGHLADGDDARWLIKAVDRAFSDIEEKHK